MNSLFVKATPEHYGEFVTIAGQHVYLDDADATIEQPWEDVCDESGMVVDAFADPKRAVITLRGSAPGIFFKDVAKGQVGCLHFVVKKDQDQPATPIVTPRVYYGLVVVESCQTAKGSRCLFRATNDPEELANLGLAHPGFMELPEIETDTMVIVQV